MSIVESWGCYSHTWFDRRWGGTSTVRRLGFHRRQWRHGISSILAERVRLGEGRLRGKQKRRGIPADGLTAQLDARGEEGREGERERLRLGFIGRRSAVEREREVHSRP
jgi:hypothetical protein